MNVEDILSALNPEIVERFKTAIALGKWANGEKLTDMQRETCMQAVLVWEHHYAPESERTGYIDRGTKDEGEACDSHDHSHDTEHEKPIKFIN